MCVSVGMVAVIAIEALLPMGEDKLPAVGTEGP
jgi:hypothetical protein